MQVFFQGHLLHYTVGLTKSLLKMGVAISIFPRFLEDYIPLWKERLDVKYFLRRRIITTSLMPRKFKEIITHDCLLDITKNMNGIHLNSAADCKIFLEVSLKNQVPVIYTNHYVLEHEPLENLITPNETSDYEKEKYMLPILSKAASKVVTVSNYARKRLKEEFGVDSKVIYHGIDQNIYNPFVSSEYRKLLGVRNDEKIVLWVARFGHHPYKDPFTFIRAIPLVLRSNVKIKFIMIGKGPLKRHAMFLARKLQINDSNLMFIDRVKRLNYYYAASDIFVMTSYNDNFGLVVGEAMACGKPVIVSNRGALKEVVGDAGYTFKYGCHQCLAEKINMLLENNELEEIGTRAHKRILKNFTWDKAARKYLDIYRSASQ